MSPRAASRKLNEYIDTVENGRHISLYYEDPEYARTLEFRFIKNGLLRGERCYYLTAFEDVKFIEDLMNNQEIDVDRFTRLELLHVRKLPNPARISQNPRGSINENLNMVTGELSNSIRLVGRWGKLTTREELASNLTLESNFHFTSNKKISAICSYNVKDIDPGLHGAWLRAYPKINLL